MKTFYSKIITFSFLIAIFLSSCVVSKEKENDLTRSGLNGNIKSTILEHYFATQSFGEIEKNPAKLMSVIEREYNKSGNVIMYKKTVFSANNDISSFSRTTYLYNENQQKIESVTYNDGIKGPSAMYTYDEEGNQIKTIVIDENGDIDFSISMKYNKKKQLESEQQYYSDGTESVSYSHKYDNLGNNIEEMTFYTSGELMYRYKRKYDIHNNMIEEIKYDHLGSVLYQEKSEYNNEGRFVLFFSNAEEGEDLWSVRYEYEEDKQGNWIIRKSSTSSNFYSVSNKMIEYY